MNFIIQIPYNNRLLKICFNRIVAPNGKYFIEVNSEESVVARFEMRMDHFNRWKVIGPVPDWILGLERPLVQAILAKNQLSSFN